MEFISTTKGPILMFDGFVYQLEYLHKRDYCKSSWRCTERVENRGCKTTMTINILERKVVRAAKHQHSANWEKTTILKHNYAKLTVDEVIAEIEERRLASPPEVRIIEGQ